MDSAWVKDQMTIAEYGRAVEKASKTFVASWSTTLHATAVLQCRRLSGGEGLALLEKHFMSADVFNTINSRIKNWGEEEKINQ